MATLVLPPRPPRQMSVAMKPLPARPAFFGFRDRFGNAPQVRLDVVCAAKDAAAFRGVLPRGLTGRRVATVGTPPQSRSRAHEERRTAAKRLIRLRRRPTVAYLRATPCVARPASAIPVKRIKVVTLTAMAPITEKIICQVADGMAI